MANMNDPLTLSEDGSSRAVLLSRPNTDRYVGLDGDYRLLSVAIAGKHLAIYEAVAGNDRYPPGRNMHVELSFAEMDNLVAAYQQHLAAVETANKEAGDAYDPFLDSDDLP